MHILIRSQWNCVGSFDRPGNRSGHQTMAGPSSPRRSRESVHRRERCRLGSPNANLLAGGMLVTSVAAPMPMWSDRCGWLWAVAFAVRGTFGGNWGHGCQCNWIEIRENQISGEYQNSGGNTGRDWRTGSRFASFDTLWIFAANECVNR